MRIYSVTCPHCGRKISIPKRKWKKDNGDKEATMYCDSCGKQLILTVSE